MFSATQDRISVIQAQGKYRIKQVWDCEFKAKLRRDPELHTIYKNICKLPDEPLNARSHALRGGRVEPFKMFHKCSPEEEIYYIDVVSLQKVLAFCSGMLCISVLFQVSLYPYVMKSKAYPTGNPNVLTREKIHHTLPWTKPRHNNYRGLLLVRVLPPTNLLRPLLAYRTKEQSARLTFPLCSTCAEMKNPNICKHADTDRSWIDAYTHYELDKALSLGYKVVDVFEVFFIILIFYKFYYLRLLINAFMQFQIWSYPSWASVERKNGLFQGYIDTFLKLKVFDY